MKAVRPHPPTKHKASRRPGPPMNCHIGCGYNLAQSLSICHKIPSILVIAFKVFVNLTGSRLHLSYSPISSALSTLTRSSQYHKHHLTIAAFTFSHSQTDSSASASMADLLCPRCRVTLSITTFEQAFQTKPIQNDTTPGEANKQNLTKLCEVVHPRQQIVCYQQQPEHAGPFSSTGTRSACIRCGVCRL